MASSLERSLYPQAGLTPTSGVQYFGNTGRGTSVNYFRPEAPVAQSSRPANNVNAGFSTPAAGAYETPESGFVQTPTESGFGGGEGVATGGTSGGGISPSTAQGINTAATIAGLAGVATGNRALSQAAGGVNAVTGATQGQLGPMGSMVGGMLAGPQGALLGGLAGQAASTQGITTAGLTNAVGSATVPGFSIANAMLGLATSPALGGDQSVSIGDMIGNFALTSNPALSGTVGINNVGLVDATQAAMAINQSQDPLGSLLGVLGQDVSSNTTAAVGAANAISAANNTNSLDALMGLTNSFGTGATSDGTTGPGSATGVGVGSAEGINGMDAASDAASAAGASTGDSSGDSGGVSGVGSDGIGFANGGMIGERPGITKRYADGGPLLAMGFAGGGRIAMGAVPSNASVNDRVNAILRNPQMRQSIVARAQQLMDSGELTPEEVTTMGRVAEAAMYNPSLYPQLRQFVAAQGMTPLPAAYDPSVVTKIIATARALAQSTPAGQVPPTSAAAVTPAAPGMNRGGMIRGPGTGRSDSIGTVNETTGEPVRVANGEYIIPEHVVRAKGQEFFDNLLRRYADVPKES